MKSFEGNDKHIVHNWSTYSLSNEQYIALSYGLGTPFGHSRTNTNMIYTVFEVFYQALLKNISNIPETELQLIKTKLPKYLREVHKNKSALEIYKNHQWAKKIERTLLFWKLIKRGANRIENQE